MIAPHREILVRREAAESDGGGKFIFVRRRPYPPSLRRMAARIIEPATGASTWAFGSQRWTRNRGSLVINAILVANHHSRRIFPLVVLVVHIVWKNVCPELE